jgi:hypothetical protein
LITALIKLPLENSPGLRAGAGHVYACLPAQLEFTKEAPDYDFLEYIKLASEVYRERYLQKEPARRERNGGRTLVTGVFADCTDNTDEENIKITEDCNLQAILKFYFRKIT